MDRIEKTGNDQDPAYPPGFKHPPPPPPPANGGGLTTGGGSSRVGHDDSVVTQQTVQVNDSQGLAQLTATFDRQQEQIDRVVMMMDLMQKKMGIVLPATPSPNPSASPNPGVQIPGATSQADGSVSMGLHNVGGYGSFP